MTYDAYTPDQVVREIRYIDQQLAVTTSSSRIVRFKKKRDLLLQSLERKAERGQHPTDGSE